MICFFIKVYFNVTGIRFIKYRVESKNCLKRILYLLLDFLGAFYCKMSCFFSNFKIVIPGPYTVKTSVENGVWCITNKYIFCPVKSVPAIAL